MRGAWTAVLGISWLFWAGCVGTVSPPKDTQVGLANAGPIGAGAVTPRGGIGGEIPVKGWPKRLFITGHVAPLDRWAAHFAETLSREFARRGVEVGRGPELVVELTHLSFTKVAIFYRECQLYVRVHIGRQQFEFGARASSKTSTKKCRNRLTAEIARQILSDRRVLSIIRRPLTVDRRPSTF